MGTKLLPGQRRPSGVPGWTVHCGARDPQFVSKGNPHFWTPHFPSLETKNPLWELRLKKKKKGEVEEEEELLSPRL